LRTKFLCLGLCLFALPFFVFTQTASISEITGRVQVRIPGGAWQDAQNN
jgi:hypothetical protein